MYKPHTKCRACGSRSLEPVLDLGLQPLANDFCLPNEPRAGYAPLQLLHCPDCTLGQLSVVVDPSILYSRYFYTTSRSDTMHHHFRNLVSYMRSQSNGKSVVEIGSNDGHFLHFLQHEGFGPVLGIDPAKNLCELANSAGYNTVNGLFSAATVERALDYVNKVDIVVARHVFCHVDDWRGFVENLERLTHNDSAVFIEVPCAHDMIANVEFDQVYHEHLSFMTPRAMVALLKDTAFTLAHVQGFPVHGGSIVLCLKRNGETYHCAEPRPLYQQFVQNVGVLIRKMFYLGEELVERNGKVLFGFGASAKATVWITASGIGKWIRAVTDTTPGKIGRTMPGTTIPVVEEDAIYASRPDYAVMFAWNYRDEILKRHEDTPVHWIIPGKEIEIVEWHAKA